MASTEQDLDKPKASSVSTSSGQPIGESSKHLDLEPTDNGFAFGGSQAPSSLNDVHHALRTLKNLEHAERGIMMTSSSHCIVRGAVPSPKLTINNVQSSVIVSGPINGAALVMGLTASVLVISCRQLRMHRCQQCVVYLRCSSGPIIEDCSSIEFAPLPDDLVRRFLPLPFST